MGAPTRESRIGLGRYYSLNKVYLTLPLVYYIVDGATKACITHHKRFLLSLHISRDREPGFLRNDIGLQSCC